MMRARYAPRAELCVLTELDRQRHVNASYSHYWRSSGLDGNSAGWAGRRNRPAAGRRLDVQWPLDLNASDKDGNPVIPDSAHVRLANAATNGGAQILRRGPIPTMTG
jgi:hypothetical protein